MGWLLLLQPADRAEPSAERRREAPDGATMRGAVKNLTLRDVATVLRKLPEEHRLRQAKRMQEQRQRARRGPCVHRRAS